MITIEDSLVVHLMIKILKVKNGRKGLNQIATVLSEYQTQVQ